MNVKTQNSNHIWMKGRTKLIKDKDIMQKTLIKPELLQDIIKYSKV